MKQHSYNLKNLRADGLKVITSDSGLRSLFDARIKLADHDDTFPIDIITLKDGIPEVSFSLPQDINFNDYVCAAVEYFPETGRVRQIYFLRRFQLVGE